MKAYDQCGSGRECWDCGKQGHRHGDSESKIRNEFDDEEDDDDPEANSE